MEAVSSVTHRNEGLSIKFSEATKKRNIDVSIYDANCGSYKFTLNNNNDNDRGIYSLLYQLTDSSNDYGEHIVTPEKLRFIKQDMFEYGELFSEKVRNLLADIESIYAAEASDGGENITMKEIREIVNHICRFGQNYGLKVKLVSGDPTQN